MKKEGNVKVKKAVKKATGVDRGPGLLDLTRRSEGVSGIRAEERSQSYD